MNKLILSILLTLSVITADAKLFGTKEQRIARRELRKSRRSAISLTGEIQLSGAFALYPLAVRWQEEFKKLYPRVKIDISAGGAGKGITDALAGVVDLGMVSREVYPAELAKGAYVISVAKDAVVPTINSHNPYIIEVLTHGLTKEMAGKIWSGRVQSWGEVIGRPAITIPIHAYTRSDACGAAETWGSWFGMRQEQIDGLAVFGDPGVASVVQKDRIAIGFNNIAYAYDLRTKRPHRGILVMPIDTDGNGRVDLNENFYSTLDELNAAIADGRYPTPPARELYLVSKGKPTRPEVVAFLEYILNAGQIVAPEAGFIPLSEDIIEEQLIKIDD
ncbi:MAG: substrate-binding domain-containing protein [Mucinivorans sp.]